MNIVRVGRVGILIFAFLFLISIAPLSVSASDCWVEEFTVSPNSSPQPVNTELALYGRGNCSGGIRASRFNIDGGGFGEDAGAAEQRETWRITEGNHTICFEIAGSSNGEWSNGARSCTSISGQGGQQSQSASLTAAPNQVTPGQTVTASWNGVNPTGNDWISLHPVNTPDSSYLHWESANGSSGSVNFSAPSQAGWYEFRYFRNGERIATSNSFEVVQSGSNPSSGSGNNSSGGSDSGSSNSGGSSNNTSEGGMDILAYCQSLGYTGANFTGDAYSWVCTRDGSQPMPIDVDAVCRHNHGDRLPYAGLRNASDAYSWYCASTPQSRPSDSSGGSSNNNSGNSGGSSTPRFTVDTGSSSPIGENSLRITASSNLRIRSGPGTQYQQVGVAGYGGYFEIVNGPENGWYEIRFRDGTGWVSGRYVEVLTINDTPQPETAISPRITRLGNGWCSAIPADVGLFGRRGVFRINPNYQLYFDVETAIGHVPQDQYFVYFKDEYLGAYENGENIVTLEGWNAERNQWQFGILTRWARENEPDWRDAHNWRLDYRCD